jgi:molybdopterin synthase sulfur carrier subunit
MAARVVFTSGFSRRYTGGVREFTVEAKNLRGVIKEVDRLYPGPGKHLVEEATVAIDGAIHETPYFQPVRLGCEVFFIPKLEGGEHSFGSDGAIDCSRSVSANTRSLRQRSTMLGFSAPFGEQDTSSGAALLVRCAESRGQISFTPGE